MLCFGYCWTSRGLKLFGAGFFLFINCFVYIQSIENPYRILGIHTRASLQEIRTAYKQRAKEWHPDKNVDPKAGSRFVEIKQAYELLSDSERRKAFDLYGITNEDNHLYRDKHDYSQYQRFNADPFGDFFGFHNKRFKYQDQDITLFHKLTITSRHFDNNIFEKSTHVPAIILFYADWCFECVHAAPGWRRIVEALDPLGVTMATVHATHEAQLARKVGVHSLPCLVMVLDKHTYVYKDSITSMQKVIDFIRWRMPYNMVPTITDSGLDSFLSDFEDNKVRALIFEERSTIRLRYLIAAYQYRDRVLFGFVDLTRKDSQNVTAKYRVERKIDTMILLKEDNTHPAATVSMADIPTETLHQLISANQFLTLPRLSSQAVMDSLCPASWQANHRRLCCVFVTRDRAEARRAREALRHVAATHTHPADRLHFAYLYSDKQNRFLEDLAAGSGVELAVQDTSDMVDRVVIIWRRDRTRLQYEWFNETWPDCSQHDCLSYSSNPTQMEEILKYQVKLNATKKSLELLIKRLLRASEVLAYETTVNDLVDEGLRSAWLRMLLQTLSWASRAAAALHGEHALTAASVLATVLLILAVGYFMAYLVYARF